MSHSRQYPSRNARRSISILIALLLCITATGAGSQSNWERASQAITHQAQALIQEGIAWYRRTPAPDRICWGGLVASSLLGLSVVVGRSLQLRRGRVLPDRFVGRFLERLRENQLESSKGVDLCEMNPSPAARIALAALRRRGRSPADLDRAVVLAKELEEEKLRRNVGTLRRIAALAPLIGLLGSLFAAGRALAALGPSAAEGAWGPALATSLAPLTAGVAIAILSLLAFDSLTSKVDFLTRALGRFGAEVIDGIALQSEAKPQGDPVPRPQANLNTPDSPRRDEAEAKRPPKAAPPSTPSRARQEGRGSSPIPNRPHYQRSGRAGESENRPIRVEIPNSFRDY